MKPNHIDLQEWLIKAEHDLGSAKLLIDNSDYYDVIVYHSHQCVEKILKWFLIKNDKRFPFIHDIVRLLAICEEVLSLELLRGDAAYLQELIPKTRYPYGEIVQQDEAKKSIDIAERFYMFFRAK